MNIELWEDADVILKNLAETRSSRVVQFRDPSDNFDLSHMFVSRLGIDIHEMDAYQREQLLSRTIHKGSADEYGTFRDWVSMFSENAISGKTVWTAVYPTRTPGLRMLAVKHEWRFPETTGRTPSITRQFWLVHHARPEILRSHVILKPLVGG